MGALRIRVALLVACAAIAALGASAAPAATTLSSLGAERVSVEGWLEARDLAIDEVVVQRGEFNYAGPACPGAGWDCAPIGVPVIQAGVNNSFSCSTDPCSVYQVSDGGDNSATCLLVSRDNSATQSCDITQENTTGPNTIVINEQITQRNDFDQNATQNATCSQTNGSGANSLTVTQTSDQATSANLNVPVTHVQEVRASLTCEQHSVSGGQTASIAQTQTSTSDLIALGVTQKQNNAVVPANLNVDLEQKTQTGVQTADVDQHQTLAQNATSPVSAVTQIQGPGSSGGLSPTPSGGLASRLDLDSVEGTSTFDVDQRKDWDQDADTLSTVTQIQDDRELCCLGLEDITQTPTSGTTVMRTDLDASSPDAIQRAIHQVKAAASLGVTWTSIMSFDGNAPTTETRTGFYVTNDRTCTDSSCNTAPGNPSTLRGEVRCEVPCGETEYKKETDAPAGARIGGLFTFQNFNDVPAPDIVITFTVPANTTLVSAPGCTYKGTAPGTVVKCKKGTGEIGGVRSVNLTLNVSSIVAPGTTITVTGTVTTGNQAAPTSSSSYVHIV